MALEYKKLHGTLSTKLEEEEEFGRLVRANERERADRKKAKNRKVDDTPGEYPEYNTDTSSAEEYGDEGDNQY